MYFDMYMQVQVVVPHYESRYSQAHSLGTHVTLDNHDKHTNN